MIVSATDMVKGEWYTFIGHADRRWHIKFSHLRTIDVGEFGSGIWLHFMEAVIINDDYSIIHRVQPDYIGYQYIHITKSNETVVANLLASDNMGI